MKNNSKKEDIKKPKLKYSSFNTIVYLVRHVWQWDKALFWFFSLYTVSNAAIPFIGIFLPKMLIDELTGRRRIQQIGIILLFFGVAAVILNLLKEYAHTVYWPRVIQVRMEFIHKIDEKAMTMDYEHAENPKVHDRIQKAWSALSGNTNGVEGILNQLFNLVGNMISFAGYIAIIVTLSPYILLYLVASVLLNYFASYAEKKYTYKINDKIAPIDRKINYIDNIMSDFSFGKDIRLYDMADWLSRKYIKFVNERNGWVSKIIIRRFGLDSLNGLTSLIRDGIVYAYLIYKVLNGMSIGNFTMYFATIAQFSSWMTNVMESIVSIRQQNLYVNDYRLFLEQPDKSDRPKKADIPGGSELPCSIEFKNVSFKYPESDKYILSNLSIKISKGERLALVGPNGAGKTTFVKLLTGLYEPTEGQILINGIDTRDFDRDEYYRLFSVVFQDIKLYAFTLAENVALQNSNNIDREKVVKCLELAGLSDKLKSLNKGIDTNVLKILDKNGTDFSGGEAQKLALARALYKDAPIVILDEPTAALDPIAEYELYKHFDDLTKNKTAIYISHRLSSTRFCDHVAFFYDGKIMEYGTHDSLLKQNGKYAEMFKAQAYYYTHSKDGKEGDLCEAE